jgi:hypothetical protein
MSLPSTGLKSFFAWFVRFFFFLFDLLVKHEDGDDMFVLDIG